MPRNLRGGNKAKKGSNKKGGSELERSPYVTIDPGGGQAYAKVIKSYGGAPPMLGVMCSDGKERMGVVSGKLRKKVYCNKEDLVLVNLRDYQDAKCDIVWKYERKDISRLVKENEITSLFAGVGTINENDSKYSMNDVDDVFTFDTPQDKEKDTDKKTDKKEESGSSSSEYETDSEEEVDIANI
jgi:translation initiation factor 1A